MYAICVLEEVCVMDKGRLNNPVLHCLLAMGAWDWDAKDGGELHQVTRVMRHVTVITSHLLPRNLEGETKVSTALLIKTWLMLSFNRALSLMPRLSSIRRNSTSWRLTHSLPSSK